MLTVDTHRLRAEGAIVTTSESFIYECMGDASIDQYESLHDTLAKMKNN